jgi:hypothetical protein
MEKRQGRKEIPQGVKFDGRRAIIKMRHRIPSMNARDIFTAAEDCRHATGVLIAHHDPTTAELRLFGPHIMLEAFTAELYLKCLLVDCGSATIPATHDLPELFRNLPKRTRDGLRRVWLKYVKDIPIPETWKAYPATLEESLAKVGQYFDLWRYRFERPTYPMGLGGEFQHINGAFYEFIIVRRPEWIDDDHKYFESTFRVQ